MALIGMDPAEVRRVAEGLSRQAGLLDDCLNTVDGILRHALSVWPGPDSERFHSDWHSTLRSAIVGAAQGTRERATWLVQQVADQLEVSGSGGSSSTLPLGTCVDPHAIAASSLLDLARASYADSGDIGDWHRLTDEELKALGIDPKIVRDSATGFSATIFRNEDGQYVVAYRGTTEWLEAQRLNATQVVIVPGNDLEADVVGAASLSRQSEQAVALALALKGRIGNDHLTFTGHSLGGRLAAVSAIASGAHAETFNAAGVSPSELMYAQIAGGQGEIGVGQWLNAHNPFNPDGADASLLGVDTGNIVSHRSSVDPLSGVQAAPGVPDAVGRDHVIEIPRTWNPGTDHGLDALDPYVK